MGDGTILDWFFSGLGTFLVGTILGGGVAGTAGWKLGVRSTKQSQRAGDNSNQMQVGRDQNTKR